MVSKIKQKIISHKKIILVFTGLILALLTSVIFDRITGFYLNNTGYFKAMAPLSKEVYDTKEFKSVAAISSQGLRNPEVITPKPKEVFRILAIGDSFTFGWGVDASESWPALLQDKLNENGKQVEVINAGLPGGNLDVDYINICKAYKNQFQADFIIIGIYNDDLYQAASSKLHHNQLNYLTNALWPNLLRLSHPMIGYNRWNTTQPGAVIDVSSIWKSEVANALQQAPGVLNVLSPEIRDDFINGKINPGLVSIAVMQPDFLTYVLDQDRFDFTIKTVGESFKEFKNTCSKNTPVAVVLLPSNEMVSTKFQKFRQDLGFLIDDKLITFDLDTPLNNISKKVNFSYVSPLNEFRKEECLDCYYPYDMHLTTKGHQKFADLVAPKMQQLLP